MGSDISSLSSSMGHLLPPGCPPRRAGERGGARGAPEQKVDVWVRPLEPRKQECAEAS